MLPVFFTFTIIFFFLASYSAIKSYRSLKTDVSDKWLLKAHCFLGLALLSNIALWATHIKIALVFLERTK